MSNRANQTTPVHSPQLKDLFCDALETPVAEREIWLRRRCRSLSPESWRSLQSLLQAHDAAGDFLCDPSLRLSITQIPVAESL